MTDLDQIRARFQPKTRGGKEYEIYAVYEGKLFGRIDSSAFSWTLTGTCIESGGHNGLSLIPRSPHEDLILELTELSAALARNDKVCSARTIRKAIEALGQEMEESDK